MTIELHALDEQIDQAARTRGVFDVHEHLVSSDQRRQRGPDLFGWINSSYLWADLVSAGMNRDLLSRADLSPDQKWTALESFLPAVRHTGYMQACRYAWNDLCDMRGRHLDASNWRAVDAAIRRNTEQPGFKEDTLVGRCGMKHILVDYQVGGTAMYFFSQRAELNWYRYLLNIRPSLTDDFIGERTIIRSMDLLCQHRVVKVDSLFYGWMRQCAEENQQLLQADTLKARTLEAYSELIEQVVRQCAASGAVGLKTAHNCCRSPETGPILPREAQEALTLPAGRLTPENLIAFETFVLHQLASAAGRHRLPLQIHTGTTYGPSGLSSARVGSADRFADLIQAYPETTFVLMHASWPYWGEIEQLAKRYPNVILDLSWASMLAPAEAVRMLESLLTSVATSKIVWGGDCAYAEESYGAWRQFRDLLSRAFLNLIRNEHYTTDEALDTATQILCSNAMGVYGEHIAALSGT